MKCPTCGASFSDLRDLCPGCLVDVRPYKQTHGIKVSYPGLGYSELVQRLEKRAYLSKLTLQRHVPIKESLNPQSAEVYEDEVLSLFEGSYHQLKAQGERSFEITVEQLQTKVNPEEVRLLYDLLTESLEEPDTVALYVEDVVTSDKKIVEVAALTQELEKFEQVTKVPVFSLKGTGLRAHSDSEIAEVVIYPESKRAEELSGFKRFMAVILDALLVLFVSIIIAVTFSGASSDSAGALTFRELIVLHGAVVTLGIALCGPVGALYYVCSTLVSRGSLGGYVLRG